MKYITNEEVENCAIPEAKVIEWVKKAFLMKYDCMLPKKTSQKFSNGDCFYNTMPCIMPPINSAGVKMVSRYIGRTPAIQGDILLYDFLTGQLRATIAAEWITKARTGAVAALAVEVLSCPRSQIVSVAGLGEAGKAFLHSFLSNVENRGKHIRLLNYKDDAEKCAQMIKELGAESVEICMSWEELIKGADVIVSAVSVAHNLVGEDSWYKKGVLVVPIHTRGFQNCDLFFDKVVVDDVQHVRDFQNFRKFNDLSELSEIMLGQKPGRLSDDERIISYNIGISLHDMMLAHSVCEYIGI